MVGQGVPRRRAGRSGGGAAAVQGAPARPTGPLPPSAVQLVDRAWAELRASAVATDPAEAYVAAHLAALRAAAALVAVHGRPRLRGRRALSVWEALSVVEPGMAGWAACFAACAARRAAAESGRAGDLTAAEASEHLARAGGFTAEVARSLELPVSAPGLPLAS